MIFFLHFGIFFLTLYVFFHLVLAFLIGGYYFYTLDIGAFHSVGITARFILDFALSYLSVSLIFGLPLSMAASLLLRKNFSGKKYVVALSRFVVLFASFNLFGAVLLLVNSERIGSEIRLIPLFCGVILFSFLFATIGYRVAFRKEAGGWRRWMVPGAFLFCFLASVVILGTRFSSPERKRPVDLSTVKTEPTGIKILILGIDGADWLILDKYMEEGILPNFKRAKANGAWGELGIRIWYTAPSWTTLFSGVDHNIHGIVDYIGYSDDQGNLITRSKLDDFIVRILQGVPLEKIPESGIHRLTTGPVRLCRSFYSNRFYPFEKDQKPLNATHIKEKRIWQVAHEVGKKTGLFSVDFSWPAEEVNGYMVTDAFMRGEHRLAVYPQDLYPEVRSYLDEPVVFPETMPAQEQVALADRLFLAGVREQYERQFREISIVRALWEKQGDYDLLIYKFRQPDSIKHRFLQFMRPESFPWFSYDPVKGSLALENIKQSYRLFDDFLGDVLDSGYTVVILSDHGFYPVEGDLMYKLGEDIPFDTEKFLEDLGWLRKEPNGRIDWKETVAYPSSLIKKSGIRINLQGRESEGAVHPDDYADVLEDIRKTCETVVFDGTDAPLFSHIRTDVEGFDLVFFFDAKASLHSIFPFMERKIRIGNTTCSLENYFNFTPLYGGHKLYPRFKEKSGPAVFLLYGKSIRNDIRIPSPEDIDVTPTLLYLLGIPISEELQGRVLTEGIEETFLERHPIRKIPTYGIKTFDDKVFKAMQSRSDERDADKELIENMRALGYMQ